MASKVFREKKSARSPRAGAAQSDKIIFPGEDPGAKVKLDTKAHLDAKFAHDHMKPANFETKPHEGGKTPADTTPKNLINEAKQVKDLKDHHPVQPMGMFVMDSKGPEGPSALETRLANLEQTVAQIHHFITQDKRPDLS